jgi:hypothetical protein
MNMIQCRFCGKEFEISDALSQQVEQSIIEREHKKHLHELEEMKQKVFADSEKKLKEQFELQLKHAEEEAVENKERNKKLTEQIAQMMKEMRDMRIKNEEVQVEMEKRLAEEQEKIRASAQKKAEEEQHGKIAEKDKQLNDALKEIEEMRRKLQQGSQQTQGEAFELEFESMLQEVYKNDKILPVGKGIKGGDIIQEVWDNKGNYNGKILWELKNTKAWSENFVDKLRSDQREEKADEAVLISEVLPADLKIAGYHNAVWITQRAFAVTLAGTIRAKLIGVRLAKQSVQAKDDKMELMYSYLSGVEFRHRVEAIVEAFSNMQAEIEKEKRYFSNKWSRDEKNIRMVIDNTYGMHGDLKAIIGKMLPQIKGLDVIEFDSKDTQLHIADGNETNGKTES